ncbi:MAG: DUF1330 domain-containing protein [Acidimicrobiia bacterium]|jgi:uncharacterized protein (DUF1330 family)
MAAFLIADVLPDDAAGYRESGYLDAAVRTSSEHGGVYLARGGKITVLEGDWVPERMIVIQFPSMDHLRSWYDSPAYQEWVAVRRKFAPDSKLIALEGV